MNFLDELPDIIGEVEKMIRKPPSREIEEATHVVAELVEEESYLVLFANAPILKEEVDGIIWEDRDAGGELYIGTIDILRPLDEDEARKIAFSKEDNREEWEKLMNLVFMKEHL